MSDDDLYAVLEVASSASMDEIRAAFRRLARAHHPDRAGGSAERMIAINRAYAVLSDPEQRQRYDSGHTLAPEPAPLEVAAVEDPPWRLDFERGDDLEDWRQMYAEERRVWEQLLRSRPADEAIQDALDRALREQLELENALRTRASRPPMTAETLDPELARTRADRQSEASRVGCAALLLTLVGSALTYKKLIELS